MKKIFVEGLLNIETSLKIDKFPIHYSPITYPFFGISSNVSGTGVNVSLALQTLGSQVTLTGLVGQDDHGQMVLSKLANSGLDTRFVLPNLAQTPQTIVLYDPSGRRQIHNDLKDIQDQSYDLDIFRQALSDSSIALIGNMNFGRPLLALAKEAGKTIVSDVHVISSLDDDYNRDFMKNADILFFSHEKIRGDITAFTQSVIEAYDNEIVVVGKGKDGALLYVREDKKIRHFPAIKTRPVVSTVGAGDALLASFVHFYNHDRNPYEALRRAMVFASYKIGVPGAGYGFVGEKELMALCQQYASES